MSYEIDREENGFTDANKSVEFTYYLRGYERKMAFLLERYTCGV